MVKFLTHFGQYLQMLYRLVTARERFSVYWETIMREAVSMGVGSVIIILIISLFVGAQMTVLTAYQLLSGLVPRSAIGSVVSASALLELAPTISSLVLAGKIGSSIAGELGTMRVSEQIDALDVMGINSTSLLILPKVVAALLVFPMLITISAFLMHIGGITAGDLTGEVTNAQFKVGAVGSFKTFQITFMLIKSVTFGFLITTISAFQGYNVEGGALEVGQASTRAVVFSCIAILLADYLLAQYLL